MDWKRYNRLCGREILHIFPLSVHLELSPVPAGTTYLGIDVSKDGLDVEFVRDQGHEAQHFPNSAPGFAKLHNWVKRRLDPTTVHACLEATGPYSEAIAEFLYGQGYRVSVLNPARIKGYAESQLRRNKTDRLDAALIADFCRTQQPAAWTPRSRKCATYRHWCGTWTT